MFEFAVFNDFELGPSCRYCFSPDLFNHVRHLYYVDRRASHFEIVQACPAGLSCGNLPQYGVPIVPVPVERVVALLKSETTSERCVDDQVQSYAARYCEHVIQSGGSPKSVTFVLDLEPGRLDFVSRYLGQGPMTTVSVVELDAMRGVVIRNPVTHLVDVDGEAEAMEPSE